MEGGSVRLSRDERRSTCVMHRRLIDLGSRLDFHIFYGAETRGPFCHRSPHDPRGRFGCSEYEDDKVRTDNRTHPVVAVRNTKTKPTHLPRETTNLVEPEEPLALAVEVGLTDTTRK